jgi:elongation factor G
MSKALQRFTKEDPTFRDLRRPESGETIICGMGELHLDVYIERMKREYKAEVDLGRPRWRTARPSRRRADYNYTHKKQTGGSGQYGRIVGYMEPWPRASSSSSGAEVTGRQHPVRSSSRAPSRRASSSMIDKGASSASPWSTCVCVVSDGAVPRGRLVGHRVPVGRPWRLPRGLPPREAGHPRAHHARVGRGPDRVPRATSCGTINQRRGMVMGTTDDGGFCRIECRGAAVGDVRLLDGAALRHPGQGRVQPWSSAATRWSRRTSRKS